MLRMTRINQKDVAEDDLLTASEAEVAKTSPEKTKSGKTKVQRVGPAEPTFDATSLIRSTITGLSDKSTRGFMTDETIAHLREKCPGWDLYALHADFERWVKTDSCRTPANWQKAFIGWVKRHHEQHRHELRG